MGAVVLAAVLSVGILHACAARVAPLELSLSWVNMALTSLLGAGLGAGVVWMVSGDGRLEPAHLAALVILFLVILPAATCAGVYACLSPVLVSKQWSAEGAVVLMGEIAPEVLLGGLSATCGAVLGYGAGRIVCGR